MPFIFKKPEWDGGRPVKIPKNQDRLVNISDNWCHEKSGHATNCQFAGKLNDF
jgi:hypothetical protein